MSPLARLGLGLVQAYRYLVSPLLPPSCRFVPSCSEYALEALRAHGAVRGSWLTARRLARCHPWCEGGLDPVPPVPGIPHDRWPSALRDRRDHLHR